MIQADDKYEERGGDKERLFGGILGADDDDNDDQQDNRCPRLYNQQYPKTFNDQKKSIIK